MTVLKLILFIIIGVILLGMIIYLLSYIQMKAWLEALEKYFFDKFKNKEK